MATPVIHVWCDEPADGPTNMAADEVLAAESLRMDEIGRAHV